MLEDGLIYDQRNFTSYYGGADPIRDFVHDDVLRRSLTDVFGDDIPQDQVGHGKTFTAKISNTLFHLCMTSQKFKTSCIL